MANRKIQFVNGQFYHVYNRGVDKRQIFMEDFDYLRFLEGFRVFNNVEPIGSIYLKSLEEKRNRDLKSNAFKQPSKQKQHLVRILSYSFMPNHHHSLLEQLVDNGITEFMRRVGTGYTNYFNLKYERTGRLFEGSFKAVLIDKDNYLQHLLRYIHLNSLDLFDSDWREERIKDWKEAKKFIDNYRWSSHRDYLKLFENSSFKPLVVDPGIFTEIFKTKQEYQAFLKDFRSLTPKIRESFLDF